jgi:DNA-binding response OmpR family regulator
MCADDFIDLRCLWHGCRRAPRYRYRILYLGNSSALSAFLNGELNALGCHISYVPATALAHAFVKSYNEYALLLFDAQLAEMTGAELARFARTLRHRAHTPIIILSACDCTAAESVAADVCLIAPEAGERLVETIRRLLAAGGQA